jgi:hypothetical protein
MEKETEREKGTEAGGRNVITLTKAEPGGATPLTYDEKSKLLKFAALHLGMAVISLIVTGSFSQLNGVFFLLVPVIVLIRAFSLTLFTLPVCLTPYRRSLMLFMSALWLLWQGASVSRIIESLVTVVPVIAAAAAVYVLKDRREPSENNRFTPWIRRIAMLLYVSLLLLFLIEILQTGSFIKPFKCLPVQPDVLACNLLYFTALGSFVLWIRRPVVGGVIYVVFWLTLGVASMIKNMNTYEPVLFPDVFQALEGISAAVDILGVFGLIAIILGVAAVVVLIVVLIVKGKKHMREKASKPVIVSSLIFMFAGVVCCLLSTFLPWFDFSAVSSRELFDRNGYVYSFITTGYRTLKTRPSGYNEEEIIDVIRNVVKSGNAGEDNEIDGLNIIVIQMESFMDPYVAEGVTYERDPIPFLRSLTDRYTSGTVEVPIYGGMTVKSEFEFLTGLSLDNLPYGYNPYMLYINETPIDSFPRYLQENGFDTVGIHDYQGEFFKRDQVYGNLGFRRFTSYEFMSGVEKKEGAIWANDAIILDQIKLALDTSRSDNNFVFAVSVQTHGAYKSIDKKDYPMEITGVEDSSLEGKLAYYISQLEELDGHIRAICEYFEQREEPTLIVMYSDHLPTFALDVPGITTDNRFAVNFYTWNNFGLPKEEVDVIELNELSTYICDWLNMTGSFMNRFHRLYRGSDNYQEYFEQIQYYKMFDEPKTASFENPDYSLGLTDLAIYEIEFDEAANEYVIHGAGLTDNTYLCVNGKVYNMQYVDSHTMRLPSMKKRIAEGDTVTLRIIGEKYGGILKESAAYEWG